MKKIIGIIAGSCFLIWVLLIAFFVSADFDILEMAEQQKLKEGKSFWQWDSKFGSLATHYVEKGEGSQHLILLHGFRAHTYTWRHLIDPLAEAGYHVWVPDLIGFGLSDKPENVPYDVNFFIRQMKAFMEAHGITKAHVVGNSMGGGLALNLALEHPEKVSSLTLISALGYPLDLPLYLALGRYFGQIWAPFLGPTVIRNGLKQIVFASDTVTEEQVQAYCLPYRFPGGAMASILTLRQFDNQRLVDMGKHYAELQQPTLIIWGEKDTLIPVSHYQLFLKDFPQTHTLLLPNCGHIPQEEKPKEVIASILDFLQLVKDKQKEIEL